MIMPRVFVTARSFAAYSDEPLELLESSGYSVERSPVDGPLSEEQFLSLVRGRSIDALLVGADEVTEKLMKSIDGLKVVSMHGSGLGRIDVNKAKELGIVVTNTPGLNSTAVAELTVGLMFCLARKIPMADNSVRGGKWEKIIGNSLAGKTLGLLGLGSIGGKVAAIANALGMEVIGHDKYIDQTADYIKLVNMEECLTGADFLSLHLPLVEDTKNLIDKEKLKLMKPGAYIINTSRGGIINEDDLYESLLKGELAGAALDVFAREPVHPEHPLLSLDNCVFTPHIGGRTDEVIKAVSYAAAQNIVENIKD